MNMKSQQKKLYKLQKKKKKSFRDKCVMADRERGGETLAK